ncbi:hypothetical protein, partial [Stenotrophomonas maltophilia]
VLDPDVMFSGVYDDGQGLYFEQAVSAPGLSTNSYTVSYGTTFGVTPIVFAALRLTQSVVQDGKTLFNTGEIIAAPCFGQYNRFGAGRVVNYGFYIVTGTSNMTVVVNGFTGTAYLLVMDI